LQAQSDYYSNVLGLPIELSAGRLDITVGATSLVFTQSPSDFEGAYHFAFNIPENQFHNAKRWISNRSPLLYDETSKDEFESESWNSNSVYFKDAAGNVLEFIARHNLKNAISGVFDSGQILNVSEIGLPSEDVIAFADEICERLELTVFKQEPSATFTPVGDDDSLFILPIKDRIWIPNSGVPAKLLPVKVQVEVQGTAWEIRGMPYRINSLA
jgi:hypothetical protein